MSRWLARLAYSFLILGGLLFWQGYKELGRTSSPERCRIALYLGAAGLSVGIGVRGIQERPKGNRE